MAQRYTRREVGRILGVNPSRLRYWERLQLVRPQARWGERFYNFGDLVALRTLQRLTDNRIPARRVRRAVSLIEQQFGESAMPLHEFRFLEQGRDVLVIPPGASRPFSPLKQQWVFAFDPSSRPQNCTPWRVRRPRNCFRARSIARRGRSYCRKRSRRYRQVLDLDARSGWTRISILEWRSIKWDERTKRGPSFWPPCSSIH